MKWFRKAADQGNASAQLSLGVMYDKGQGVPRDAAEAVKWFRKAADQGNAEAQHNLGLMYAIDPVVPNGIAEAYKWWLLAEAQGNKSAREAINLIKKHLSPAQRAEGQRMAREFKAKAAE